MDPYRRTSDHHVSCDPDLPLNYQPATNATEGRPVITSTTVPPSARPGIDITAHQLNVDAIPAWPYDFDSSDLPLFPPQPQYWPATTLTSVPSNPSYTADVTYNTAQSRHQHQHSQHRFPQDFLSTPSPAAFNTPIPSSYYLSPAPAGLPYAHYASPDISAYPTPVSRSMSVSALSNTSNERSTAAQQQGPQPTQRQSSNTFLPTPRQIRFVSSDGQPHAKRRRINAACLTCRKRKTRCSGERPACKTCTNNGHKCAGYASKSSRKDVEKRGGDGDDDDDDDDEEEDDDDEGDFRSVSPGRMRQERAASTRKDRNLDSRQEARSFHQSYTRYRRNMDVRPADVNSPASVHTAGSSIANAGRTRVPYFRYFGPTAIVPGFKQMVVQMKDGREHLPHRRSHQSVTSESSVPGPNGDGGGQAPVDRAVTPSLIELPYYDAVDPAPNPQLITHLCEAFFVHLGCNYPFLQRERFLKDIADKRVDAILVNAVCAVAARFSSDPMLTRPSDNSLPLDGNLHVKRAFRGQPFAQRAMSAVIDMFPCPTLAVTQACLLLAYEEFGSDRDSGLWMYLGTAIRMAQDLGIQKLEGLQLEGWFGPTPKSAKRGEDWKQESQRAQRQQRMSAAEQLTENGLMEDRRASEQERIDTFWAVFFLDRAVSSGVGRPVTLRDKDIEISFPYRSSDTAINGYPQPFPTMIRIVHMYGRVADVLNNMKEVDHVTPDVLQRLTGMEKGLTSIYQNMSPKLHFNAPNFQHFVKAGEGTNFILLHFWFHTLIVLLHQPTLLHSFEGRIQQLFPGSRELSMSSAKTIADILAFAELIDVKSFIGNPFTSQPMYVAACAFLAEAAAHASQPPSTPASPHEQSTDRASVEEHSESVKPVDPKKAAKHSLLAAAANQNYQRCYKALKMLDSYWAGCRYILTALDQKSKGLMDPLLFTSEDVDEMPSTELSFTTPGWRGSSIGVSLGGAGTDRSRINRAASQDVPWSPRMDFRNAIGWSLTDSGNSPAPNLSVLYQNCGGSHEQQAALQDSSGDARPAAHSDGDSMYQPSFDQNFPDLPPSQQRPSPTMTHPRSRASNLPYDPVSTAEADLLLGLHSPYPAGSSGSPPAPSSTHPSRLSGYHYLQDGTAPVQPYHPAQPPFYLHHGTPNYNDMLIESHDVDVSSQMNIHSGNFNFPGGDMLPWLEYLPQDVLNYFGETQVMSASGDMVLPSGPGPPQQQSVLGPKDMSPSLHRDPPGSN